MNQYREQILQAQKTAAIVNLLKKNNYLTAVGANDVVIDHDNTFVPVIHRWYRIEGFRAKEDEQETKATVSRAAYGWLRGAHSNCSAFVMDHVRDEVRVFYGTGSNTDLGSIFSSIIPECIVHNATWEGATYAYNGILSGTISADSFADTFAGMRGGVCYIACVVIPVNDDEVWEKIRENEVLIGRLEQFKSFQRVYGNATRRTEEIQVPEIVRAISLLKDENTFLSNNVGRGFVRSCVRFGASDRDTYYRLGAVLRSCMHYDAENQEGFEPVRLLDVHGNVGGSKGCLAVPRVNILNQIYHGYADLVSWQTLQSLEKFCSMPINSYTGFYVRNNNVTENTLKVFPEIRPIRESGIAVGSFVNSSVPAVIPLSALYSHMLITGATRSGKTTTVKGVVKGLYNLGIPTLVIEAAKKEYIGLLSDIPALKVLTPGNDGLQLYINPLQVETGTLIENHVDAVVRAITASTAGEHPIPEALEGLLKQTYEKAGWHYGMMAYEDEKKPFPTFKDAYNNIPEYIKSHARYGVEVKQNLEGALTLRTENMYTGALGRSFSKPFGITAKELLETPTVIELADFSDTGTEFLMNILLFKLHCYISRLPESNTLKRVIVVEEAHNVFRKTLSEDSSRARSNDYFEKMLAEISASGTGMILCDQRPGIMSDAVIANTSVKVVHALTAVKTDLDLMASSLGLSSTQAERIMDFDKGICLIGIRGIPGVQHVKVKSLDKGENLNPACHICAGRFRCRKASVLTMIQSMDEGRVRYHISKIQANPYNTAVLARNIDCMLLDLNVSAAAVTKCCLLGVLLQKYGTISYQESRVILNSYNHYLKGGANNE